VTIQTDIAILGGGPGGYVAALRAAQLGAQVTLVEQDRIGGVCLTCGCIPTKALLRSAEVYRMLQRAESFGLCVKGDIAPNWPAILARKGAIVQHLVGGVEKLLDRAGVHVVNGRGQLVNPRTLEVETAEGAVPVEAARGIVIATGSRPIQLPLPGMDLAACIDSTGALELEELPQRLLIIGGGVVGVELADVFSAFGTEVTIVEMLDRLLPQMEADLGAGLAWTMEQRGIRVHLKSRLVRVEAGQSGMAATIATPGGEAGVQADKVLIAAGRRPNIEELGLEAAGVQVERTGIPVNSRMETNAPGVYAIGDVTGAAPLAHVAMRGGEVAVENALGGTAKLDLKTVPWCVYTEPEVASVGLTEAQAREAGHDVAVGRFPLNANGKALTYGETDGLVKIVSEARYGEVLGLHLIAPHASDLIHEGGMALALEATLDELSTTLHGHPTLGEAIREAALECRGGALHLPH